MNKFLLVLALVLISGCSVMEATHDILDIFYDDDDDIVCNEENLGTIQNGEICVKYGYDNYKFVVE